MFPSSHAQTLTISHSSRTLNTVLDRPKPSRISQERSSGSAIVSLSPRELCTGLINRIVSISSLDIRLSPSAESQIVMR